MKIKQFRYGPDNLAYLVYGTKTALAVDPGAVDEMIAFAKSENLTITFITNTHSHHDHTTGNREMLKKSGGRFLDCGKIRNREFIDIDGEKLLILYTPGHMDDCLSFRAENFMITGDTLFNGTVGNCFSGDMKSFLDSVKQLTSYPKETLIYAGHDYVKESMAFARTIDKNNPEIERYLERYNPDHVVSTLEDEFKANPYVRFNDADMIEIMKKKGLPVKTEYERWLSIMELY